MSQIITGAHPIGGIVSGVSSPPTLEENPNESLKESPQNMKN